MSQPKWKLVANLGDVNPIDHGGYFVYEDETGVYPPEAELLEVEEDEDNGKLSWTISRFILEPCTFASPVKGGQPVLSDNSYHPDYPAWFADDLPGVASATDQSVETLRESFCSDDSCLRASAYRDVGGVVSFGFENFDEYPIRTRNRKEVVDRYKEHETVR